MQEGSVTTTSMKISFKVPVQPKKDTNKLQTNAKFQDKSVKEDEDEIEIIETRKRNIICLEDGVIKGDEVEKKKEKKEYCINIEKTYDWRIQKLQKLVEEGTATEEDKARLELMIEAFGGDVVKTESNDDKIVSGAGHDITQGSSLDADYDEIPINEFGQAFLRGCGWKKDEGIGRTNKRVVPLHVSEARPKGLGLGSHVPAKPPPSKSEKNGKNGNDENEVTLKKRTRVKILSGIHQGAYAEVCSLDEDNSSCFVELFNEHGERNGVVVRVSQFVLQIRESRNKKESSSSSSKERSSSSREYYTSSKQHLPSSSKRSSSSKSRHSDNRR